MVQFGAFWAKKKCFCQNNVDSAAYSRIGSYAPGIYSKIRFYALIKTVVESSNSGDLQSITSTRLVLLYVVKFGPVIFSYAQRRK